eukprot:8299292-Pyramimonas_sp.AAC.1
MLLLRCYYARPSGRDMGGRRICQVAGHTCEIHLLALGLGNDVARFGEEQVLQLSVDVLRGLVQLSESAPSNRCHPHPPVGASREWVRIGRLIEDVTQMLVLGEGVRIEYQYGVTVASLPPTVRGTGGGWYLLEVASCSVFWRTGTPCTTRSSTRSILDCAASSPPVAMSFPTKETALGRVHRDLLRGAGILLPTARGLPRLGDCSLASCLGERRERVCESTEAV